MEVALWLITIITVVAAPLFIIAKIIDFKRKKPFFVKLILIAVVAFDVIAIISQLFNRS